MIKTLAIQTKSFEIIRQLIVLKAKYVIVGTMKTAFALVLASLLLIASGFDSLAAPIPPLGPIDVSGTVSELLWVAEKKVKGIRGMSGSAGVDRVIPAHFLMTLKAFQGIDSETARAMTRYFDQEAFKYEKKNFMPTFIILKINHNDKNYLKKGMKITVTGYTVMGDEGGTWTHYRKIDIIPPPTRPDAIQQYLESSLESPNAGGKMFCAYELYGAESQRNKTYLYLWATCSEYYLKDAVLRQGTAVSEPVALMAKVTPGGYVIKAHKKPLDGEGYGASIRKIFPHKYHDAIFAEGQKYDRRAEALLRETAKKARAYYHLKENGK
jgi:hypothetical protein